jgi:hypothetical protein
MLISEMLRRFRPVYAADGEGGTPDAGGAAVVDAAIAAAGAPAEEGDEILLPEDEPGDGEPAPPEEFEDLDVDGLKLKVQKGRKADAERYLLREADYTKKTMALSAKEKAAEAAEAKYTQLASIDEKLHEGRAVLNMVDADLNKEYQFFNSPEYQKLQQDDFVEADRRWKAFQMAKENRARLAGGLGQLHQERTDSTRRRRGHATRGTPSRNRQDNSGLERRYGGEGQGVRRLSRIRTGSARFLNRSPPFQDAPSRRDRPALPRRSCAQGSRRQIRSRHGLNPHGRSRRGKCRRQCERQAR